MRAVLAAVLDAGVDTVITDDVAPRPPDRRRVLRHGLQRRTGRVLTGFPDLGRAADWSEGSVFVNNARS